MCLIYLFDDAYLQIIKRENDMSDWLIEFQLIDWIETLFVGLIVNCMDTEKVQAGDA